MSGQPETVSNAHESGDYVVVARRYRPKTFSDLVGQSTVSTALQNALTTDRVGHAYLFTGARGVGKTSTARILAKSLNCAQGVTTEPCGQCDLCEQISAGNDVDVLEIDGASNRGIDEIRQLRSNVGIRPSRSRFKIYIIDEVHMLTKEAFNALLKTLEEPPEHVKFVFCTTEPEKIPITVLSRCQRFDFAPVKTAEIINRLRYIVQQEGAKASDDALELLARRAAGSMRDSQSLLEQLLSFVSEPITVDHVHSMLGTARDNRLRMILDAVNQRDPANAIRRVDEALEEGVDVGQLAEQLVGCLRDMMIALVGCEGELLLSHSPSQVDMLREVAEGWGMQNLLAAAQILDQAVARMRTSVHARVLLDLALIRVARLEDLELLADLIQAVKQGSGTTIQIASPSNGTARRADAKKKRPALNTSDTQAGVSPIDPQPANAPVPSSVSPSSVSPSSVPPSAVPPSAVPPPAEPTPAAAAASDAKTAASEAVAPKGESLQPAVPVPEVIVAAETLVVPVSAEPKPASDPETAEPSASAVIEPIVAKVAGVTSSLQAVASKTLAANEPAAEAKSDVSLLPAGSSSGGASKPVASKPVASKPVDAKPVDAKPVYDSAAAAESQKSSFKRVQLEEGVPIDAARASEVWRLAIASLSDMTADYASMADGVAISGPNHLVVQFRQVYNASKSFCERTDRRQTLEQAVAKVAGRTLRLDFEIVKDETVSNAPVVPKLSRQQQRQQATRTPFVEQAVELFQAEVVKVDVEGQRPKAP